MSKKISFYLFILFAFILNACSTGTQDRLNCICLIDYSGSLSEQTLNKYIDIITENILENLREKDRLIVLPIDEGAKIEPIRLVFEDLSEKKFSYHTDGYTHARDSLLSRLNKYIKSIQPELKKKLKREKTNRQKYTYYTDIFSALEQAVPLLEHNELDTFWDRIGRFVTGKKKLVSTNAIFIFSDMIHESNEISFANPAGCTPDEAQFIIDKLNNFNKIPNLEGCMIFVNGRTGTSNEQVDNIQNFWLRYFKEAKAKLNAYDYDVGHEITAFLKKRVLH